MGRTVTTPEQAPEREWAEVGTKFIRQSIETSGRYPWNDDVLLALRVLIDAQIDALKWVEPEGNFPMSPGLFLQHVIEELNIPRVTAVAHNGVLELPDGPETATYSICGIEGNYRNGRVRLYILDSGTGGYPLATDVWSTE